MKALHSGKIEKGKLILDNPERWQVNLAKFESKPVEFSIQQKRSIRSGRQNRYYHGVIVKILADHFGYSSSEMHEVLKYRFLRIRLSDKFVYVQSTAKLNTKQMETYNSKIREWASTEHSCFIPDPNSGIDF